MEGLLKMLDLIRADTYCLCIVSKPITVPKYTIQVFIIICSFSSVRNLRDVYIYVVIVHEIPSPSSSLTCSQKLSLKSILSQVNPVHILI
jgi:hypothetical protein